MSAELDDERRRQLTAAIRAIQTQIRWKPGRDAAHLLKRRVRGHLPIDATLADYESVIETVVSTETAIVYLYWHDDTPYVAIVHEVEAQRWLVMFSLNGIMETAFVVENPDSYLNKPVFEQIGPLGTVVSDG